MGVCVLRGGEREGIAHGKGAEGGCIRRSIEAVGGGGGGTVAKAHFKLSLMCHTTLFTEEASTRSGLCP